MVSHDAVFSTCRAYRYTLWRCWDMGATAFVQFIGLNPSTADEVEDDPTVRRCINFAKRWGYGAMFMTNIFAYRATDPKVMMAYHDPIGEDNDIWIQEVARQADRVVAAWGRHGEYLRQGAHVLAMLYGLGKDVYCLGTNSDKSPKHPLYIPGNVKIRTLMRAGEYHA